MNLQFYLEKLRSSDSFKNFIKINPDAFLCSGFFVIDKQSGGRDSNSQQHFDFFLPKENKIMSFQLETNQIVQIEPINDKIPEKILLDYDFDFKDIEKMISEKIEKKGVKNKIQKILLSLQRVNKKDFLVGTIFISMLGMIKISIDISEKKIVDFEEKSFFDMFSILKKKKD